MSLKASQNAVSPRSQNVPRLFTSGSRAIRHQSDSPRVAPKATGDPILTLQRSKAQHEGAVCGSAQSLLANMAAAKHPVDSQMLHITAAKG